MSCGLNDAEVLQDGGLYSLTPKPHLSFLFHGRFDTCVDWNRSWCPHAPHHWDRSGCCHHFQMHEKVWKKSILANSNRNIQHNSRFHLLSCLNSVSSVARCSRPYFVRQADIVRLIFKYDNKFHRSLRGLSIMMPVFRRFEADFSGMWFPKVWSIHRRVNDLHLREILSISHAK